MPEKSTFWSRHVRTICTYPIIGFSLAAIIMMSTAETFESAAEIRLPLGLPAAEFKESFLAEGVEISPPKPYSAEEFRLVVRPIGHFTPEIVALAVESSAEHSPPLAEIANAWATDTVKHLGRGTTIRSRAIPAVVVRPKKVQNMIFGSIIGTIIGLLIAGLSESSKQRGAPIPFSDPTESPNKGNK